VHVSEGLADLMLPLFFGGHGVDPFELSPPDLSEGANMLNDGHDQNGTSPPVTS